MSAPVVVVIAANVRDGREWTEHHAPQHSVIVTPRSMDGVRGCLADSVVWTRGALRLPQEVRDRIWRTVAPALLT
ncbi:hypothetical protein [Oerskovia enterophila]|uniref:PemK-like protein n=1 Tax=Oerskovia enterophila TaxID=43678 RepID=A0ABX2Y5P0_9CELL|nr:hypothetical protein [Oerskovia enterophila]OCI31059.1 hypothetical protein OERS_22690 [Oerskovia enterophila]